MSQPQPVSSELSVQRAFLRIRLMYIWAVVGSLTAAAWDGWWHQTVVFDGFFSPPHVMAYLVAFSLAWLTNDLILNNRLRPYFGAGVRMPFLTYAVPGPLVLLGGSLVMLGFAGLVLDNFWHTFFGLNETGWSFPHAMIGWALLLMILGFASSRMALGEMGSLWKFTLGWLVTILLMGVVLGPIGAYASPDMVYAESLQPIYLDAEEMRHLFRIYLDNNLNRSNPLVIVLAPLPAAAALAFVLRLGAGPGIMLGVALLVSVSGDRANAEALAQFVPDLLANEANYAPMPLLSMALTYSLLRWMRLSENLAWAISGVVFGLALHHTFGTEPGMAVLAILGAVSAVVGARAGVWIYALVRQPDSWPKLALLLGLGLIAPFISGLTDLYLRITTP